MNGVPSTGQSCHDHIHCQENENYTNTKKIRQIQNKDYKNQDIHTLEWRVPSPGHSCHDHIQVKKMKITQIQKNITQYKIEITQIQKRNHTNTK